MLRSDGGERGNLKSLSRDDADTVDDLPAAFQHFDLRGVRLPGGPCIDRAGRQRGLGVGGQQERQLDGIDRNIGLTQRRQHKEVTNGATSGGNSLASQIGEFVCWRSPRHHDGQALLRRATGSNHPHRDAGGEAEREWRIPDNTEFDRFGVHRLDQRGGGGELSPGDLIRNAAQCIGRLQHRTHVAALIADTECGFGTASAGDAEH